MGDIAEKKEEVQGDQVTLSRAEVEQLKAAAAELPTIKEELERQKLEVFTDDYMDFLDQKDKGGVGKKEPSKEQAPQVGDEDFEKMTKKQIFDLAVKTAREQISGEIGKVKEDVSGQVRADRASEVARFARTHADYAQVRPMMYGLSLDKKNADLSLQELYDAAKSEIQRLAHPETTPEEKERQRKLSGEKPGGSSESIEEYKKLDPDAAAAKAMELTKQTLGGIPPA